MADDEEAERLQQELLEASIASKEEELQVLEELRREGGGFFSPRQSLARTPPQVAAPTASLMDQSPPTPDHQGELLPMAAQHRNPKQPLTSPEEVQDAVRRRIAKRAERRAEVPPIGGLLSSSPAPPPPQQDQATVAPVAALTGAEWAADPLVSAPVEQLAGIATSSTRGIMEAVRSKTSKLNKDEVATIGALTERLNAVITHMTLRLAAANARVERAAVLAPPPCAAPGPANTFANALRLGRNINPVPIARPPGPSVAIYPAEDQKDAIKTSDATKEALRLAVNPASLGIQVVGLRKVGNAGIVVQTTSTGAANALRKAVPATLRTAEPINRQPLIALTGIDKGATTDAVISELVEQNLQEDATWTTEKVASELRLLFKKSRHNGRTRWVCQASHELRRALISRERVYIGWDVVEVTDFVDVTCCSRCQLYGHPEKYCRAKAMVCGNCGEEGHKSEECQSATPVCATCKRFPSKESKTHRTASRDCPARAHAEKRSVTCTNYG